MATITRTKIGPMDHGRPMSYEDFLASDSVQGFHYELINGKVYASLKPNLPHRRLGKWLHGKVKRYSKSCPAIINFVNNKTRILMPHRKPTTCPEPDLAAYHDFPLEVKIASQNWEDISPILVAEILTENNFDKDLVRNVDLYLQVTTIREYWLLEGVQDPDCPSLRVYRRHGSRWRVIDVAFGETYTTKMLPGFELVVDPRK